MRLLRRDKRYMRMIAGGMYKTVSPKTKLPVPDDQLKAGIKKTVTKLPDPKPVTPKQRPNVGGGMTKAQEDAFEKEYEAFIAQQKKLKAEREAAEAAKAAAEQTEAAEPEVDVAESPVFEDDGKTEGEKEEPLDEVIEEGEVTAEGTEEVEPVQKKTSRKKKADAE
jgi:hypothetical protein